MTSPDRSTGITILVVDDHVLIREALAGALEELQDNATVLAACDCRQAMQIIQANSDLRMILLDLNLPDRDGFSVLAELRERHPDIAIVVLSAFNTRDNVLRALRLGALGFIPKSAQREVMLGALRLVFAGGIYIPPEVLDAEDPAPALAETAASQSSKGFRRSVSPRDVGLTERQIEVLALMMQGKSNKAIARMLALTEPTVKKHVTAILKALKVSNRTEAVIAAGALGWEMARLCD
jgi:DNA-binding NarL/FixJ family response regulator